MKPICRAFNAGNDFVFELRHHPIPECEAILAKSFEAHGNSHVGVLDSALRAKLLQSEFAVWVVDVRSKTVRFEHHALRHVCQPAVHRPAKNSEGDTATAEMRSHRKSVRTRADNHRFDHNLRNYLSLWFLSIAAVGVTRKQGQSPMLARNRAIVQTLCSGL